MEKTDRIERLRSTALECAVHPDPVYSAYGRGILKALEVCEK